MEIEDSVAFKTIIDEYYNTIAIQKSSDLPLNEKIKKLKHLQNKLKEIRIPNTNYREDQFAELLESEIKMISMNTTTSFGETVYNEDVLRPFDQFKMYLLNSIYEIQGNEYLFLFNPKDYLYNGKIKFIDRTFYEASLYNIALKYLIQKHNAHKEQFLVHKTHNIPAFCEIFFEARKVIINCNFDGDFPLFQNVIYNTQQVNPSCSMFVISFDLEYTIVTDKTYGRIKEFTAITDKKYENPLHYSGIITGLLYRKNKQIQLYAIDNNFHEEDGVEYVIEHILLQQLQNKIQEYSNKTYKWVWEEPIFIKNHIHYPLSKNVSEFNELIYSSLLSILVIDIIDQNFVMHDVLNAIKFPPNISVMTDYLKNMMKSIKHYFNNMKKEHYWIFLCNYARLVSEYILFPNEYESLKNSKVTFENFTQRKKHSENDLIPVPDLKNNFINREFNSPPMDWFATYIPARNKYNENRRKEYASKKIQFQLHSEKFGGSKPKNNRFIIKKLNDILNDKKYTGNTKKLC